ncbi:hypothetical protein [Streptomyces sp. KS 21]|uniref:hypothetical protein n=1 Tax=Streptomyces sp. KS 21 TaxID=2485150 RepID=UPI0010638572|nr:hypothetical protein [Streptomyces sp. KS 21]TDU80119.1 hypothetical protein EDD91_6951 [Streptomyces sp. KS 21]
MTEADETARQLGIVCANADRIRGRLRRGPTGDDAVLEAVLTAVRDGRETVRPVDDLHAVLQSLGDSQGLYAYGGTGGTAEHRTHPAGVHRERSGESVYLCPARRCTRYGWPGHGSSPVCAISGETLRLDRL